MPEQGSHTTTEAAGAAGSRWLRTMRPRDPGAPHRAATPLELLFDLCFVVAIALAASKLHHGLAEAHFREAVRGYALVFFAIWWAWVNFTWFASAYDTDDVVYRTKVFVVMTGVLVLAAGIPRAFEYQDFLVVTLGYTIMRVALVAQWLRAARNDPPRRRTALRYAFGITLCQIAWIALLFVPAAQWLVGFCILAPVELLVPAFAERAAPTTWHPHHITERYGLLTLIVLGESVLASTVAIQSAIDAGELSVPLLRVIAGGLLILFNMWWIYFDEPVHRLLSSQRVAFQWGYAHYFVFASAAAVGAGLAVNTDVVTAHAHISHEAAAATVAVPVAVFVFLVWWLHCRPMRHGAGHDAAFLLAVAGTLAAPSTGWPVLAIGVVLTALVASRIWSDARRTR